MNLREIETLVDLAHVARISEVTVRANGRRITIRKDPAAAAKAAKGSAPIEIVRAPVTSTETVQPTPALPDPAEFVITAPMVGIFHAPEPAVAVGVTVQPGQVVGIIESMRLMNDIRAEIAGTVDSVLVEDGMAVEYGQAILRLRAGAEVDEGDYGV
jgi:acetyl-CoA carboxylase biotin carboxyl carrier protein